MAAGSRVTVHGILIMCKMNDFHCVPGRVRRAAPYESGFESGQKNQKMKQYRLLLRSRLPHGWGSAVGCEEERKRRSRSELKNWPDGLAFSRRSKSRLLNPSACRRAFSRALSMVAIRIFFPSADRPLASIRSFASSIRFTEAVKPFRSWKKSA